MVTVVVNNVSHCFKIKGHRKYLFMAMASMRLHEDIIRL